MAEDAPSVNSMVFDYLKSVSEKIANSFKKQVKDVQDLPEGSPKLTKVIESYGKRKINDEGYGSNNGTPSKKPKLNGISNGKKSDGSDSASSSSGEDEDETVKKSPVKTATNGITNGHINGKKKDESSDDDSDSDEEMEEPAKKPVTNGTAPVTNGKKKAEESSSGLCIFKIDLQLFLFIENLYRNYRYKV